MSDVYKSFGPTSKNPSLTYDPGAVQLSTRKVRNSLALVFHFGSGVLKKMGLKADDLVEVRWGIRQPSGDSNFTVQIRRAEDAGSGWQLKPFKKTGGAKVFVTNYPDFYQGKAFTLLRLPHETISVARGAVCSLTLPKVFFEEAEFEV